MSSEKMNNVALKVEPQVDSRPDVRSIMAAIRARVASEVSKVKDRQPAFIGQRADFSRAPRKPGELIHSEELRYLNAHHAYPQQLNLDGIVSHRPGPIGRLVVAFKRKAVSIVWHSLLKDYFSAEKDFQSNLVRYLNDVSKYVDARDAANFLDLVAKIDTDNKRVLDRVDRLVDQQAADLYNLTCRVDEGMNKYQLQLQQLQNEDSRLQQSLGSLESMLRGIETLVARLKPAPAASSSEAAPAAPAAIPDQSYVLLENRFRGSEEEIARRSAVYPPLFSGAEGPLLDIGCGRGELLGLLKTAGYSVRGIDLDQAMVDAACSQGLDVKRADALLHLPELPDSSLGGVIAIQVVEHLNWSQLEKLFNLCRAKVKPGGRVIFETVNPRSLLALSSNYFRDPSHVFPLHPDTLSFGMQLAGLHVLEVKYLSPVPEQAMLQPLKPEDYFTPRWAETIESFNGNIKQLNDLLYGYQDYCVVAEVR